MKTILKNISELFKDILKEIAHIGVSFIVSSLFFALVILIVYGLTKL
jgi:hypothetical protein